MPPVIEVPRAPSQKNPTVDGMIDPARKVRPSAMAKFGLNYRSIKPPNRETGSDGCRVTGTREKGERLNHRETVTFSRKVLHVEASYEHSSDRK